MKIIMVLFLLVSLAFSAHGQSKSSESIVITMRKIQFLQDYSFEGKILDGETIEFSNGNTFAKLIDPSREKEKFPIAYKNVTILAPANFDANDIMELLFKSFSARMQMAKNVNVAFPHGTNLEEISADPSIDYLQEERKSLLNLKKLLEFAGIKNYFIGKEEFFLSEDKIEKSIKPSISGDFMIVGDTHEKLRNDIASELGVRPYGFKELVDSNISLKGKTIYLISPSPFPVNKNLLKTMAQINYLAKNKKAFVHLVSPYLPYARSDKGESDHGVGVQGSFVADLLTFAGMGAITVVRPHAPQSLGFFKVPSFEVTGRKTINNYLSSSEVSIDIVVSPDAGFQKDATKYAQEIGADLIVLNKQRSVGAGAQMIGDHEFSKVKGKKVAIIDDEAAGGGTLLEASRILKENGALEVYAVVTHMTGKASKILGEKGKIVKEMVCTDSLPFSDDLKSNLTVLSIAKEISDHLRALEGVPPLKVYAVFDLGSSKVKMSLFEESISGKMSLLKEVTKRVPMAKDLAESNSCQFSKRIMEELQETMESLVKMTAQYGEVELIGVATEVYRKANNGGDLILDLKNKFDISLNIISQDEEAVLGHETAKEVSGISEENLIAWDHGGGSFQLTAKSRDKIVSYQGDLGAIIAAKKLISTIGGHTFSKDVFYPVKKEEALQFVSNVKKDFPQSSDFWVKRFSSFENVVIGIGGETGVFGICAKGVGKDHFNKGELWKVIEGLLDRDQKFIKSLFPRTSVQTVIPRLLAVYSIMDHLQIREVKWIKTNGSTVGILKRLSH